MKCSRTLVFQLGKSGSLPRRRFIPDLVCLLSLLALAGSAQAQISIDGVTDKTVYADTVSFIVNSEAGYDYTVELNGVSVATDVWIEVDEPEYYELYVHRVNQSTSAEESRTLRFIVRDSSRGSSETGLPTCTPYPPIDSAAAEFVGAQLKIVTPAQYPMGLEIPVVARIDNTSNERVGVVGDVTAAGFEGYPLKLLRGVGSVFLPAATEPSTISYDAQIHSLQNTKQITIEASTTWQTESGNINSNTNWGTNARIHIDGALTIGSSATLTIGPGTIIKVDPDLEIAVNGSIVVNGTTTNPVVFTAQDRNVPWGGFLFEASTSRGDFNGTIMTASGADSNWFNNNPGHGSTHRKEQCLFYLSNGAKVTLTDCYLVDNHGQAGHGESSYLTMTGCLVQKSITTGQYNHGAVILDDTALIEFPSYDAPFADDDSDALYLTGGAHSLTDCLIGWALDDGIDAGSGAGGTVTVDNCWLESCYHDAMAWSGNGNRYIDIADTVAINSGQGIESGWGLPFVDANRCLSTANMVGARFGDNYDWDYNGFLKVSNSLLLYNSRDVWGRNWDDWTVRLAQMDIQNNYLSAPNANYPNNLIWDPQGNPGHLAELEPFLPTPAETVGIGLATLQDSLDITDLSGSIPVRLSTFTTSTVSVNYSIEIDSAPYDSGTLQFIPGQTVKEIPFAPPGLKDSQEFDITISAPVNAELTGFQQITVTVPSVPYEVTKELVVVGDDWLYRKGTSEPPSDWNELLFTPDETWLTGATPIGYERHSGYESCIVTDVSDMYNSYLSVYARKLFTVDDPNMLTSLTLGISYDDGYIAYINGVPVHSQNPPNPIAYNTPLSTDHEGSCSSNLPEYDLTAFITALEPGDNVLAIQIHNKNLTSSDLLLIPALSSVATPTPGDFEPDGDVDFQDFAVLALSWQSSSGDGNYNPYCDINTPPDYSINMLDLLVFVDNWLAGF